MDATSRTQSKGPGLTLPPLASMTQGISKAEPSPGQHATNSFDARDSGNWSAQSQQSKREFPSLRHWPFGREGSDQRRSLIQAASDSSPLSNNTGFHLHSILNSEDSPSRFTATSPQSATRLTASSRAADTVLPTINQSMDSVNRQSTEPGGNYLDSRRSSIDGRINTNMGHLNIGQSPTYENINASHISPTTNLHHQRGIHTAQPNSNGAPPTSLSHRPSTGSSIPPPSRRAPAISNPNAGGMPDPLASTPTKGYPWAFPGEPSKDEADVTSSPGSSRHDSFAASSLGTMDSSVFPVRSSRLPDDLHSGQGMSHRSATSIQSDGSQLSTGNYSRTPELRVSHKLAERKRRSEMKDLFDQLHRHIPNSTGSKSSKWEILSKAIDYIQGLKEAYRDSQREIEKLRTDMEHARVALEENRQYQTEITAMHQQLLRIDGQGHHVFGPKTHQLEQELASQRSNSRLAPMQQAPQPQQAPTQQTAWPATSQMQGVEYGTRYDRR